MMKRRTQKKHKTQIIHVEHMEEEKKAAIMDGAREASIIQSHVKGWKQTEKARNNGSRWKRMEDKERRGLKSE